MSKVTLRVLKGFIAGLVASLIISSIAGRLGLFKELGLVLVGASITFFVWGLIANMTPLGNYFRQQRAQFIRPIFESSHIFASWMVYFWCALGLQFFVLPIVHNVSEALLYGLIFALVVEGVFGFASYSSVNHYSAKLLITGMIVGCIIISGVSVLLFWLNTLQLI